MSVWEKTVSELPSIAREFSPVVYIQVFNVSN